MEERREQIGERLADACASFHHEVFPSCQRPCHRGGHGLLLRSPLKSADRCKAAILGEERLDLGCKAEARRMVFVE